MGFIQLLLAIRRQRFDLVHFQHETRLYGGPLSLLLFPFFIGLVRRYTVPVVTLHHVVRPNQVDRTFANMHHTHIPPMIIRWGYVIFYRLLGLFAPSIIVHDNLFKEALIQEYAIPSEHIFVVPHGAENLTASIVSQDKHDLLQQFNVPQDAGTIFGFFGYFTGYKGIEFLLEEFSKHAQKFPKSVLLIGGKPNYVHDGKASYSSYVDNLKKRAERTASGRVIWYGAVPDARVGQFFRLIDCLVLPYRLCFASSGPLSYAIGSSIPFLASEALRPLVPYDGLLFPLQSGALAEKMDAFVSLTPLQREALTSPLKDLREEHRWDAVAGLTIQAYERSLKRATHRTDIMLVGAYGQQNTGDELLLNQCLSLLPREHCTVASSQPSLTEAQHHVFSIHSHKRRLSFLRHFLQARTIVVGGGDQFKLLKHSMNRARYSLLLQCFLLTLFGRVLQKSVLFISVGIGNVSTFAARFLTIHTLRLATAVSFREQESYNFCRKFAPRAHAFLAADLAFLNTATHRHEASSEAQTLGIAPVFNIDHAEQFTHITQETGKAIDSFLGMNPKQSVLFLPFQTGFNAHDDIMVSDEMLAHVEQRHRCRIAEPFGIDRIDEIYSSLDVLWGIRLHSIILACLHAIPFIALIYDVKVKKFLEEIDCASWSIPLDDSFSAEKLFALHTELVNHLPDVRHHLQKQAKRLMGRAQVNEELLMNIAKGIKDFPMPELNHIPETGSLDFNPHSTAS
ncbi:MAG: polysaccharide pyruvyl transferase family protein [Candidatus Peregrinibacteria bacterium]